jgi:surface antigen
MARANFNGAEAAMGAEQRALEGAAHGRKELWREGQPELAEVSAPAAAMSWAGAVFFPSEPMQIFLTYQC